MSIALLNKAVNELEIDSSIHTGNLNEAGLWLRFALAAEQLAGASTTANANIMGYMLRSAVALESLSGTSGAEETQSYYGYMKRIVDALEAKAGAVTSGTLEGRLAVAAAAAVYGGTPTTLSPTYTFGSQYPVLTNAQLDWSTGSTGGPYWPNVLMKSAGQLPSDFPVDVMVYYSSDHSDTAGGIAVVAGMRDAGQASKFLFKTYEDALVAGWFDSIATKPATSPLFSEATKQLETPWVRWLGGTSWICYYQRKITVNEQRTMIATSSNGLSWSNPSTNAIALPLSPSTSFGDYPGHSGYLRMDSNVLSGVPYAYVGYSLYGGTDRGMNAIWGASAPEGPWTFIKQLSGAGGFLSQTIGGGTTKLATPNPTTIIATPQGYTALTSASGTNAGGEVVPASVYEVLLASDGVTILGAHKVFSPTPATFSSLSVGQLSIVQDAPNSRWLGFFVGNDGTNNTIGMVEIARASPSSTYIPAQSPVRSAPSISVDQSFLGVGSLPSGFELPSSGTVATPTYDANGLNIGVTGSTGLQGVFNTTALDASTAAYIDMFVEFQSFNTTESFQFYLGLFGARDTSMNDGVRIASGSTVATDNGHTFPDSFIQARAAGVTTTTPSVPTAGAVDNGTTPQLGTGYGGRRYRLGCRYYPAEGKICWMQGDGENELRWVDNTGAPSLSTPLYAGIVLKGISGSQTFAIRNFRVRLGGTSSAPGFKTGPTITPTSGDTTTTFTASETIKYGTLASRRWLLNGVSIGTGSTVVTGATGSLVLEETATGPGGTTVATSSAITVTTAPELRDTFTDTDATALTSHTSTSGHAWQLQPSTTVTGTASAIASNRVWNSQSAAYQLTTAPSSADQYAQIDIVPLSPAVTVGSGTSTAAIGVILRASSSVATFYAARQQFGGTNSGTLELVRFVSGSGTVVVGTITGTGTDLTNPQTLRAEMRTVGSTVVVEFFKNGVSKGTITDSDAARLTTNGRVGIRGTIGGSFANTSTTGFHIDNFTSGPLP